jgi:hypothetical protein
VKHVETTGIVSLYQQFLPQPNGRGIGQPLFEEEMEGGVSWNETCRRSTSFSHKGYE